MMAKLAAYRKARADRNAGSIGDLFIMALAIGALLGMIGSDAGRAWLDPIILALG